MKNLIIMAALILGCGQLNAQTRSDDWAGYERYAHANQQLDYHAQAVFMGNSITDAWPTADPAFFDENRYLGRGISGQTTYQMLARFYADVVFLAPRVVVILAGTNDIAQNQGKISIDNIFWNIVAMCDIAKSNNIQVVLCSVLPAYEYSWRKEIKPADQIKELNRRLQNYAEAKGIPFADYWTAMADNRGGLPKKLSEDGVHPTKEGYAIMKEIVKPQIDKALGN